MAHRARLARRGERSRGRERRPAEDTGGRGKGMRKRTEVDTMYVRYGIVSDLSFRISVPRTAHPCLLLCARLASRRGTVLPQPHPAGAHHARPQGWSRIAVQYG